MLFVTTTPARHKSGAFRLLGEQAATTFLFFSRGREPYRSASGIPGYEGLRFEDVGGSTSSRIGCVWRLTRAVATAPYDVMIKCINGKWELVVCYLACRLRRRRFVLWTGIWKWPDSFSHRLGRPVVRHILRRADAVCTYGPHVSRFLCDEGVPARRLFCVPQPVEPDRLFHALGRRPYDAPSPLRVLFVGRLVAEKGLAVLLTAAGPLADRIVLTVAGDGPERQSLERAGRDLGLDITWLGEQDPGGLPALYRASDCVVIPSLTTPMSREPWAFVANEAMLCGCAVVASTAVGAAAGGLVTDGVTGLVFPEGDAAALREHLRVLAHDRDRREALARAGEDEARRYTEGRACAGFLEAIASVSDRAGMPADDGRRGSTVAARGARP